MVLELNGLVVLLVMFENGMTASLDTASLGYGFGAGGIVSKRVYSRYHIECVSIPSGFAKSRHSVP